MNKINIINQVKEIILKHTTPNRIYLYGSQANGEAKVGSDIDIAYDAPDFKSNYLIEEEVDKIETLLKIDVKNIAKTEERFKNRVKSSGKVIYSATKQLRAEDGLHNFASALEKYESAVKRYEEFKSEGFGDVYLDLIVKRFEFTYEMSWKALKRYLEFLGFEVKNPRQTFKEGYAQQILDDENIWLDMIEQRNLSSHIYDEIEISEILDKKESYLKAFLDLKINLELGLTHEQK
ncbi:HI0074 family nucleotidyltransferase substrate-binding subunit [Sulfurimonas sp.]|uniref:HI0074 family nucleotidyltransferase substrate-binding subunit n=1 Tax=Sulfurimonas sp. TaxID=2022749 RepID=UPI003D10A820